jgi:hypothetical protein
LAILLKEMSLTRSTPSPGKGKPSTLSRASLEGGYQVCAWGDKVPPPEGCLWVSSQKYLKSQTLYLFGPKDPSKAQIVDWQNADVNAKAFASRGAALLTKAGKYEAMSWIQQQQDCPINLLRSKAPEKDAGGGGGASVDHEDEGDDPMSADGVVQGGGDAVVAKSADDVVQGGGDAVVAKSADGVVQGGGPAEKRARE